MFCISDPNLVFLAWAGDELWRWQAQGWCAHTHTHADNDNTRRPKRASGKNKENLRDWNWNWTNDHQKQYDTSSMLLQILSHFIAIHEFNWTYHPETIRKLWSKCWFFGLCDLKLDGCPWDTSSTLLEVLRIISKRSVNSLGPRDTIWQHRSGSTLGQVMACCLMAPSHYLTLCWLIISEATSPGGISMHFYWYFSITKINLRILLKHKMRMPGTNELTHWGLVTLYWVMEHG